MAGPLELVAFVTRAENRVASLLALETDPRTRPDLQDETGIPRATLSRILADFRERDLVRRRGHQYQLTPLGERLATELSAVFEAVEEMQMLQTVAQWLPIDELGVTIEELAGGTVTTPSVADPLAPMKRAASVLAEVDAVRVLCPAVVHQPIVTAWRSIVERGQQFEGVLTSDTLDVVSTDPEMIERLRAVVAADNAALFVVDKVIPHFVIVADRTVLLVATDEEGAIQGLVETDNEAVRSWAESTIEGYKADARAVVPEVLTT